MRYFVPQLKINNKNPNSSMNVLKNANQNELNDVALANIEALAWGNEVWIPDNANCSSTAPYPYCCTVIIHTYWTYPHW